MGVWGLHTNMKHVYHLFLLFGLDQRPHFLPPQRHVRVPGAWQDWACACKGRHRCRCCGASCSPMATPTTTSIPTSPPFATPIATPSPTICMGGLGLARATTRVSEGCLLMTWRV